MTPYEWFEVRVICLESKDDIECISICNQIGTADNMMNSKQIGGIIENIMLS